MLVIVNSLHKSGSTWFYSFVNNCLVALGHPSAHEACRDLVGLNQWANPGALEGENLQGLRRAAETQTFAIKAHSPPNPELLGELRTGRISMIFVIRHPAAIVRSALAFGEQCRAYPALEPDSPYAAIYKPEDTMEHVAPSIDWAVEWLKVRADCVARYEDVFATDESPIHFANCLHSDIHKVSRPIFDRMKPQSISDIERRRLRVNLVDRPVLTASIQAACNEWASSLGYP